PSRRGPRRARSTRAARRGPRGPRCIASRTARSAVRQRTPDGPRILRHGKSLFRRDPACLEAAHALTEQFQAPGKLVPAGEYAALEGAPAVAAAIDRHVRIRLFPQPGDGPLEIASSLGAGPASVCSLDRREGRLEGAASPVLAACVAELALGGHEG